MIKKAAYILSFLLLMLAAACSKDDVCMLEGEGTVIISGVVSDKSSTSPVKDMKIIFEAYTTRGKLIDSKTVYSSSDGTYTVESSGYTSEINCILKASDSSDTYAESTVELNVDWNGSPFDKATCSFIVNNCNFYMKRK